MVTGPPFHRLHLPPDNITRTNLLGPPRKVLSVYQVCHSIMCVSLKALWVKG